MLSIKRKSVRRIIMVIDSRVLWDSLVTNAIEKFEYDVISYEDLIKRMGYLGFKVKDIQAWAEETYL
jgi:hypothetical protein